MSKLICLRGAAHPPPQDLIQTTQALFRLNPLLLDSQPTSASWIRWIACGWKHARSSSSVRHSRSCLSDLWDSESNGNPISVQCKKGKWEQGVRFWLFRPHWSSCQKIKMMQCALFYGDLGKQKLQHGAFLLPTLAPLPTELSEVFQAGCFNFAQMKAYVELWINKLSDAAAKSGLETNCEKFDSELR